MNVFLASYLDFNKNPCEWIIRYYYFIPRLCSVMWWYPTNITTWTTLSYPQQKWKKYNL